VHDGAFVDRVELLGVGLEGVDHRRGAEGDALA
jgi:hypothetical protein